VYRVVAPSDVALVIQSTCYGSSGQPVGERGTYSLVVDSNGATGAYDLTVVRG
jgi:hypothetical protein